MARVASNKLCVSDRKTLEKRIVGRFDLVKQSICAEQIDMDQIKEQMLQAEGVIVPSTELAAQHKDLTRQREEMIEPHIQEARNKLRVELSELDAQKQEEVQVATNDYKQVMAEVKAKFAATKREIDVRYEAQREELQKGLETVRQKELEERAKDINSRLDELKKQEIEAAKIEREVEIKAQSRINLLRRQAGRITQIIEDSQNKILEQLLFVETRSEAKELIEKVPTVSIVLKMLEKGPEGLADLICAMNPEAAQAMGALRITSEEEASVEAQIVSDEEEEEDPYSDENVTSGVDSLAEEDFDAAEA